MQKIFLPDVWMVVLFIIVWFIVQVSSALIAYIIPDRLYKASSFLFKERRWEKSGLIYERVFKIRKWKHLLPDGAKIIKNGYRKKHLTDLSEEGIEKFIVETCRAELTHLLAILPFWVFGFFSPPYIIPIMLLYALIVNLPCMIAQRYNRPKFIKLLNKKRERILNIDNKK